MEQTASKERAMSSFTKRKGQTTYKVNVFFAENTTSTFEDKLLHLMANDIANRKQDISEAELLLHKSIVFRLIIHQQEGVLYG
ncbi:transposon-encoded TnpW family protein [Roseburia faecis]|uniref:transposon-encoded TnpW family protein n=2 Tax=Roseburia faecis TaxID=301302 RepID=UPI003F9C1B91